MSDHPHVMSVRANVSVFIALLVLLFLTIGAAYVDFGRLNFPIAMTIAVLKAALILMYFMHLKFSPKLTRLFATASFFWLAILIGLAMSDYSTRGWLNIPGK